MAYYYTSARNIQIVIALMKSHGIKRVITSPGATDIAINFSLQHDPYFELYSCIDERSAAYMACGMAAETGINLYRSYLISQLYARIDRSFLSPSTYFGYYL